MNIHLSRVDDNFKMKAVNERNDVIYTDGSPEIGASNTAFRPMEMLLVSLAGCSAIDVISILKKQRQTIEKFEIDIKGERVSGTPAPFKYINVHFTLSGDVMPNKLEKALELTKDKYCSVLHTLSKSVEINYHYTIE